MTVRNTIIGHNLQLIWLFQMLQNSLILKFFQQKYIENNKIVQKTPLNAKYKFW